MSGEDATASHRRPAGGWLWLALALAAGAAAIPILYAGPVSFDEALYHTIARDTQDWLHAVVNDPVDAISEAGIEHSFSRNREHPVFSKILAATSNELLGGHVDPFIALRAGNAVLLVASVFATLLFLAPRYGAPAALLAAAGMLFVPPLYGSIGILSMDYPMAALGLLTTLAFVAGIEDRRASVAFGVLLGLAFNTKINAGFTAIPLVLWALLWHRQRALPNFLALAVIAPITCFATWPWLWHDTFNRIVEYLQFHIGHDPIAAYYFGKFHRSNLAPWHYPWFYFVTSIPVGLLAMTICAALGPVADVVRRRKVDDVVVVLTGAALMPILSCSLPGVPKYDGPRLFLGAFPLAMVLAGVGLSRVVAALGSTMQLDQRQRGWLAAAALVAVILPALAASVRIHPYGAYAYFNELVTAAGRPSELGLSPLHMAMADRASVEYLERHARDGDTIWTNSGAAKPVWAYRRAGLLTPELSIRTHGDWFVLEYNFAYQRWRPWRRLHEDRHSIYRRVHEVRRNDDLLIGVYRRR